MGYYHGEAKDFAGDMGVDFHCGDGAVPEKFLNETNVQAVW